MKLNIVFLLVIVLITQTVNSQKSITISGGAMFKSGTKISVERFEDYFTRTTVELASTELKSDSTFEVKFMLNEIEKIKLLVNNDYCYIYVQPGASYRLAITNKRLRNFNNPLGNEIDASLLDLPKEDINYKILAFDLWYDQFMGENYHLKTKRDSSFVKQLIKFEERVGETYKDESNDFLKTYVKYRVASIEDLNFIGCRNERTRFTVNLAAFSVYYKSEEYMIYMRNFYKNFFESLAPEINKKLFKAIVAGSPTRMINILAKDYRVLNVRLRELVMIVGLADVYHDKNYPQSRIHVILDSISNHGLFKENKIIARNTLNKLRQLNPGSPAPKYVFADAKSNEILLKTFQPKYTYIQFVNLDQANCLLQIEMLKNLHAKYNSSVAFITVVMNDVDWTQIDEKLKLSTVAWSVVKPNDYKETAKQFQLTTYPYYVLIDAQGYVVQSPAASPVPDGSYKTIDYYFFEIHKSLSRMKN